MRGSDRSRNDAARVAADVDVAPSSGRTPTRLRAKMDDRGVYRECFERTPEIAITEHSNLNICNYFKRAFPSPHHC